MTTETATPPSQAQTSENSTNNDQPNNPPPQSQTTAAMPEGIREEFKGLVENKGWKDVNEVLNSYQNLEKLTGRQANAVQIPDPEDTDGWNKVFTKLGRPENANGYDYGIDTSKLDDASRSNIETFNGIMFEAGLSNKQAVLVQQKLDEIAATRREEQETAFKSEAAEREAALKKEWGQAFDTNIKLAEIAAEKYGLKDIVNPLALGESYDKLMKLFSDVGAGMSEDGYVSGGASGSSKPNTPAQAKRELAELQSDPDYLDPRKNPQRHKMLHDKAKELYSAMHPSD